MKFVIQRVSHASVTVNNEVKGKIDTGFMVLVGISDTDDEATADKLVKKMCGLRIFQDSEGKTNLSLSDDCKKGNRPSFIKAGKPDHASKLYEYIIEEAKKYILDTQRGVFGADMKVELLNDGPFTVILDSDEL